MRLSRRDLLSGNSKHCHIVSMVIQCLPDKLAATAAAIESIPNLEVPERDERGKLIALIEVDGEAELMERISKIESTPGVISATLAYHQIDDEKR